VAKAPQHPSSIFSLRLRVHGIGHLTALWVVRYRWDAGLLEVVRHNRLRGAGIVAREMYVTLADIWSFSWLVCCMCISFFIFCLTIDFVCLFLIDLILFI